MLVLSRKENERLRVGESIILTIVEVNGERVKVGIEAPKNIPIVRDEILNAKSDPKSAQKENSIIKFIEIELPKKKAA